MSSLSQTRPTCVFRRHQHIARIGEAPDAIYRIEEGWAGRYTTLASGSRQITALFLPGEYCEPQWLFDPQGADPVLALTEVRAQRLSISLDHERPRSETRSLVLEMVTMIRRQSRWIVSLGRMSAFQRLCTVLADLFERSQQDRIPGDSCSMPLTQTDLADVVGLTPIHTNRILRSLHAQGLVELGGKRMRVSDIGTLRAASKG